MPPDTATSLSSRLAAVATLVPEGVRAADIGCDHGRLALALASTGRAAFVVATEADAGVLARSARPPAGASWSSRVVFRAGDGLAALRPRDEIDTAVIAGLGGVSAARILDARRLRSLGIRRVVVQPQRGAAAVRGHLAALGWAVVDERLVLDRGRAYPVVAAERGDAEAALRLAGLGRADVLEGGPVILARGGAEVVSFWAQQLARLSHHPARAPEAERAARILRFLARPTSPRGG